jgi:hypothetical protein
MHHDSDRSHRNQRDRREILHRIVRQPFVQRGVDRVGADRPHHQGRAVRLGLCDDIGSDRTAGAAAIVDDDGCLQRIVQQLRERTRDNVGRAAGRKRHDQPDLLRFKLCGRAPQATREKCRGRHAFQNIPAMPMR